MDWKLAEPGTGLWFGATVTSLVDGGWIGLLYDDGNEAGQGKDWPFARLAELRTPGTLGAPPGEVPMCYRELGAIPTEISVELPVELGAGNIAEDYAAVVAASEGGAPISAREKCDAIFDCVDVDKSGKLEISEVWCMMSTTTGMSDAQARSGMTEDVFNEQMMPALGGGTGMDKDQLYKAYTELGAGNIAEDYAALTAVRN